jgi:hypothetical protein
MNSPPLDALLENDEPVAAAPVRQQARCTDRRRRRAGPPRNRRSRAHGHALLDASKVHKFVGS